jgi:hypothetical protein
MPGPLGYAIWFLGTLLEAIVVVCALRRSLFKRYFFLNLYMLLSAVVSVGRFRVLAHVHNNLSSPEYRYFYFYSDAVLTIVLFLGLISLYVLVFEEMKVERYVRLGAVVLLAGTSWFSYAVVSQSSARILTHFAFELSQNLYFVGLILTYVLWGAILKLRETRAHVVQLVLSLGIYFSAFAASYSLSNLQPNLYSYVAYMVPIMGCLLPLSWAYSFWSISDKARLVPSRLAVMPR